ncbi:MAG: response regulator [Campylobacterota bacterium]|nr:response regulator [Campylobacterota bacterium]
MMNIEKRSFHILCVDDTITNLKLLENVLTKENYLLTLVEDGSEALKYLQKNPEIDLILLDIMMPGIDGYQVCSAIKNSKNKISKIPIIFLTAISDIAGIKKGFDVGGIDYITKPFNKTELLARIKTHIDLKFYQDQEIEDIQKELIFMMSTLADKHSEETGDHVRRVADYSELIARLLGFDEKYCEVIRLASAMHDIGKVTVPDHILNKPAKLNDVEFAEMKKHAQAGYDILKVPHLPLFDIAATIAYYHHEKWDGSGYPRGLKGKEIHILGRIVAFADVFDALGHTRKYKGAWPLNDVFSFMRSRRGIHFDPEIVDIFSDNIGLFLDIKDKFATIENN